MAFHNTNYEAYIMSAGTYNAGQIGNNVTASTIHEVFCLSAGTITITALGGGTFTWPATAGQSVKVLVGGCIVSSGTFVGFKAARDTRRFIS